MDNTSPTNAHSTSNTQGELLAHSQYIVNSSMSVEQGGDTTFPPNNILGRAPLISRQNCNPCGRIQKSPQTTQFRQIFQEHIEERHDTHRRTTVIKISHKQSVLTWHKSTTFTKRPHSRRAAYTCFELHEFSRHGGHNNVTPMDPVTSPNVQNDFQTIHTECRRTNTVNNPVT